MDKRQMLEVLETTLQYKLFLVGTIWIVSLLILMLMLINMKRIKTFRGKRLVFLLVLYVVIVPLTNTKWFISAFQDIEKDQVVCCEASYERDYPHDGWSHFFVNDSVYVRQEKNEFRLTLPWKWSEEQFPEGEYYGTIYYSKESKVILYFLPAG